MGDRWAALVVRTLLVAALAPALTACQLVLDFSKPVDGGLSCDGSTGTSYFPDQDGDGFGAAGDATVACTAPTGYVADDTDCDDSDEAVHPGAVELCNQIDDDCSDTPDDGTCAIGCADGEREAFDGVVDGDGALIGLAGCAGGFDLPGVIDAAAGPACGLAAGDDAADPTGAGCRVADLCADGWHVCSSPADVGAHAPGTGCDGMPAGMFFVTRQSGTDAIECADGANNLRGCGTIGLAAGASCAPINMSSGDVCGGLGAPWSCGTDGAMEAVNVTKPAPEGGGALCCRDP